MEALARFLPIDRRLALAAGRALPERDTGSVLFADIAGFTPLTEGLTRELGPQRGPEELTQQLDRIYADLIDAVHRYRGSVVGFGGDAITCWFPGDEGRRALTCAAAIHAAMRDHATIETPAGTRFALAIKVAIAEGPVRRFVLGDPALRRMDVIAGRTLDRMAAAEKLAREGETVVTAELARRFAGELEVGDWRAGGEGAERVAVVRGLANAAEPEPWPALEDGAADAGSPTPAFAPWLWPSVRERVLALRGGFLAELRPAVALFLQFGGIDYDADADAGARLDAVLRSIETVLDRFGGTLLELSFGDKGSHAYAAFGAPQAHADDAARAVGAALALVAESPRWLGVEALRIGLARGPMRTGAYGSASRATYSVMGDRTNLAARLMAAAGPGGILCDDAVYDRARRRWRFEALPALRVKGKSEPVPVFRPTGEAEPPPRAAASARGALIGRRAEQDRLEAALAAARAGEQRVLDLVGEGGIGKSRLVAELVAGIRAAGLRCSLGAGLSLEQHTPYRAWRDLLAEGFDLADLPDSTERRRRVETRVAAGTPELLDRLPLLDDILGLGWSDNPLTAGLDPALRHESLVDLVIGILREWSRAQPCLLVLDDAQWLDSLSWELVVQVARGLRASRSALLLLLAERPPDPASPAYRHRAALQALGIFEALELGGMDPEETVALAAQALGVPRAAMPDPLAAFVRERSEGNPFFAEEVVLALRDGGLLRVETEPGAAEGSAAAARLAVGDLEAARSALPTDIQGLVLARIDRLPAEAQRALKVASVIGRSFAVDALAEALAPEGGASPAESLVADLDKLVGRDLVLLEASHPERIYAFNHIITQETAYGTLLFQQRRGLHRTVARWYEKRHGLREGPIPEEGLPGLEPFYPLLAHHYQRAEASAEERPYARLAGEHAAAQFANAEALRYLGRALELSDADDFATRYRVLAARESVHDRMGEREAQGRDIAALAAVAEQAEVARWQPEVALRQANLALAVAAYDQALAAADRCIRLAEACEARALGMRGRIVQARVAWQQGRFEEARLHLQSALADGSSGEFPEETAQCWLNLAPVERHRSNLVEARRASERALDAFAALGDRQGELGGLSLLGAIAGDAADFAAALRYNEQALALCRQIGHRRGLTIIEGNLAADLFDLGDYAAARVHLESALRGCRELGDRWGEGANQDTLGLVLHREGEPAAAREELRAALAIQREIGDQQSAAYTLGHLGDVETDRGDLEAAASAHAEARDLRRALGQEALAIDNVAGLARVALARGDREEARRLAEEAMAWLETQGPDGMEFPVWVAWTCHQGLREATSTRPADPARARVALARAHALVRERAEGIAEPERRRSFLEAVPFNRAVVEAWAAVDEDVSDPSDPGVDVLERA